MLQIVLTPKILGTHEIGGPKLKPFQPNGNSAPVLQPPWLRFWTEPLFDFGDVISRYLRKLKISSFERETKT